LTNNTFCGRILDCKATRLYKGGFHMRNVSLELTLLYDFYGEILTEKQRELFDLYYNEDLSLAEIAEHLNITRQGVRDGIVRSEEILRKFEEKLGLAEKFGRLSEDVKKIISSAETIKNINDTNFRNLQIDSCAAEIIERANALDI